MQKRVHARVSNNMAAILRNSKRTTPIDNSICTELLTLYEWLADLKRPWKIPMGHLIPRDKTLGCTGDVQ